jgi:hypothetical protein
MTLPSTGAISLSDVNAELCRSPTAPISLNDSEVRALAGKPTGAISMQDLRGKTAYFDFSITSNQTDANLRTLAVNAGWDQCRRVRATINPGVVISGSVEGSSTAALTIDGAWPKGVELTNNGTIVGRGGAGGNGGDAAPAPTTGPLAPEFFGIPGSPGGRALSVSTAVSINNGGTIAGGGGGGGGGHAARTNLRPGPRRSGGGGGGGGQSSNTDSTAGLGGPGPSGSGTPGTAGTFSAAGTGGAGGANQPGPGPAAPGGPGGVWGVAGTPSVTPPSYPGLPANPVGGGAGDAIVGNPNITWIATGTRLGGIT